MKYSDKATANLHQAMLRMDKDSALKAVSQDINIRPHPQQQPYLPDIQQALSDGANPNACLPSGYHPLFVALSAKDPRVLRALLEHGANPNAPSTQHASLHQHPLEVACWDMGNAYNHLRKAQDNLVTYGTGHKTLSMEQFHVNFCRENLDLLFEYGATPPENPNLIVFLFAHGASCDEVLRPVTHLLISKGVDPRPCAEFLKTHTDSLCPVMTQELQVLAAHFEARLIHTQLDVSQKANPHPRMM